MVSNKQKAYLEGSAALAASIAVILGGVYEDEGVM